MIKIISQISRLLPICARKLNLIRRTLRPQCGADAQNFLSAVYNRGTQAKKRQANVPQYGRSMIEMLGVLTIIGVLTVGSITAYSKAMRRHLLNKQRQQISYILSAIETHYDELKISSTTDSFSTPVFINLGWIPQEMIKDDSVSDVFNNKISVSGDYTRHILHLPIYITNKNAYEQCVNLYQTITQFHSSLWLTFVSRTGSSYSPTNYYYGDRFCGTHASCIRNLTLPKISQLCHACDDYDQCILYLNWK